MGNISLTKRLALHVLTDRDYSKGRDTVTVVRAALQGGATVIQLRDKTASTRELVEQGLALRDLTREYNAILIVNDRIDVALAVDADGAHIGQDDMPAHLARTLLGSHRILGISAGNLIEAQDAIKAGADYLGVGPIFTTATKSDAGAAVGLDLVHALSSQYDIPLIAIGGIKASNIPAVMAAGATGVAVITAVVSADDITTATRDLYSIVRKD